MPVFVVQYYAGPYSGRREVEADDADEAVRLVRARVRREMTLPMYADGYEVIEAGDADP